MSDGDQHSDFDRIRTALFQAPFPVMVYAEDGQVIQVNDLWIELSGYGLDEVPTLAAWYEKTRSDGAPPTPEDIDALFESEQRVEEGEHTVSTRYGGEVIWEFSSAPLGRLPDGRRAILRMAADVTERKRLEQALWATNRRMTSMIESITDGFFALDREWRFVYVNERAEKLLQLNRQELIGKNIWEDLPQAEALGLRASAERAVERNITLHTEARDEMTDGSFEFHFYPSEDGLSVYFRNITARVRMAEVLRSTTQRLQALIKASPLGVIALTPEDDVDLWSPAAERIYGWTEQEALGRPLPAIPPGEVTKYSLLRKGTIKRGEPVHFQAKRITRDGRVIDVAVWGAPMYDADGKDDGIMGLVEDITEQKRAEAALKATSQALTALVAACPLAIVVIGFDAIVQMWNPASERIFGWTTQEVLGRRMPIIPPDLEPLFQANCQRLLSSGTAPEQRVPCLRKDGSSVLVNLAIAPIRDAAGQLSSLLGIMSPVT